MTLEALLEMDADTLSKMTDEELCKHFEPMLNVTRPERQEKRVSTNRPQLMPVSQKKQAIFDMLADGDDDIKMLLARRRKK